MVYLLAPTERGATCSIEDAAIARIATSGCRGTGEVCLFSFADAIVWCSSGRCWRRSCARTGRVEKMRSLPRIAYLCLSGRCVSLSAAVAYPSSGGTVTRLCIVGGRIMQTTGFFPSMPPLPRPGPKGRFTFTDDAVRGNCPGKPRSSTVSASSGIRSIAAELPTVAMSVTYSLAGLFSTPQQWRNQEFFFFFERGGGYGS